MEEEEEVKEGGGGVVDGGMCARDDHLHSKFEGAFSFSLPSFPPLLSGSSTTLTWTSPLSPLTLLPPHSTPSFSTPPLSTSSFASLQADGVSDTAPGFQDQAGNDIGKGKFWQHRRVCYDANDCITKFLAYK